MFVSSQEFRSNPILYFIYDKSLPMGSYPERLVSSILDCCDNPKGSGAYKKLFIMSQEKNFVDHDPCAMATLAQHVFGICSIDKDQTILKTLHYMYISSVTNRDNLPMGQLDQITDLYQMLKEFYEETALQVREINYFNNNHNN